MTPALTAQHAPAALQALLAELIDYAGLFPPASLDMSSAVANYARYAAGEYSWVLGRFILPASRLGEFKSAQKDVLIGIPWRLSALVGVDAGADHHAIAEFNRCNNSHAIVDTVEVKFSSTAEFKSLMEGVAPSICTYCEVPLSASTELLSWIRDRGARAKIRMGGVLPNAIPPARAVAHFIANCVVAGTALKATAGLHHPLRGLNRLTNEVNAPTSKMHGFLNLFLALLLAYDGATVEVIARVLDEECDRNFVFNDSEARWIAERIRTGQILAARERFAISFGSCSFDEPIEDLRDFRFL